MKMILFLLAALLGGVFYSNAQYFTPPSIEKGRYHFADAEYREILIKDGQASRKAKTVVKLDKTSDYLDVKDNAQALIWDIRFNDVFNTDVKIIKKEKEALSILFEAGKIKSWDYQIEGNNYFIIFGLYENSSKELAIGNIINRPSNDPDTEMKTKTIKIIDPSLKLIPPDLNLQNLKFNFESIQNMNSIEDNEKKQRSTQIDFIKKADKVYCNVAIGNQFSEELILQHFSKKQFHGKDAYFFRLESEKSSQYVDFMITKEITTITIEGKMYALFGKA
ncbi:MAG: hypothetical protein EOP54_11705 [Sphingobacteriales bacterium]|nr:MAG: hypothetical protein EOP54_11705 [Sphingobacteriales bacterium]